MKNWKLTLILFFIIAFSCAKKDNDYIFQKRNSLKDLKLNEIISFEKEKGSKERLYDNTFTIGKDYYPNKHKFKLSNPRVFERKDKGLNMESDYFYSTKDSLIKTVFYMWKRNRNSQDTLNSLETPNFKILQKKYDVLKNMLTHKLGKSTEPPLEPGCYLSLVSYCQWKNKNMTAYLAIHKYELRLTIYSE